MEESSVSQMQEGTGTGLIEFLDWAGTKGLMKPPTASGYRSAVIAVLGIDDDGESLDIRTLDVDDQLLRFTRRSGNRYTPSSLNAYTTRFRKAIEMYRRWLDDPSGRIVVRERRSVPKKLESEPPQPDNHTVQDIMPPLDDEDILRYPFPLRSGRTAYLYLPRELPSADIRRMTAFIQSLAIDPPEEENGS